MVLTAGQLAREHGLKCLKNTYGDRIPNGWPLAPAAGWPDECGWGGCDVEYVDLPDGSCTAVSCNEHYKREGAP